MLTHFFGARSERAQRWLLVFGALAFIASRSFAQTVRIDFEDIKTGGRGSGGQVMISRQYEKQGLVLNDAYLLDYSKTAIADFAHSGSRAIEQCVGVEIGCETPFELTFTQPQSRVKVWVGYFGQLRGIGDVRLETFDAAGNRLKFAQARLDANNATRIRTALEVGDEERRIRRARVSIHGVPLSGFALDDIEFEGVTLLPDLVIRNVAHRLDGERCTLSVTIENIGRRVSPGTTLAITSEGHGAKAEVPRLAPNQPITVPVDVTWALAAGAHVFHAAVDPEERIQEEREDNNAVDHTIEIAAPNVPAPNVVVPNVVGVALSDARATVERAGFVVSGAFADLDPAKARVRSQTPAAGALAPMRSTVNLVATMPASVPWWISASIAAAIVAMTGYTVRSRTMRKPLHSTLEIRSALPPARTKIEFARARLEMPAITFRFASGPVAHRVVGEPVLGEPLKGATRS